ncbi:helix-turn-helix domain-containing protein [Zymomonas mobilis]|uniref:helix-turn-helix domain-containing protein n=1 Tax=Zymomonas mobilis TaxID=542 RepID=UPI0039E9A0AB
MAKMTLADIRRSGGRVDRKRLAATTDEDILRQAKEDGTDEEIISGVYPTAATVRRALGMTQKAIADLMGIPLATWQNWEQGRVALDPAIRTLLKILWKEPEAVRRAVAA